MPVLVELRGVSKHYRRADTGETVVAVEDVSLDVHQGEVLGVIGYSGAGKSTLVRLVNALELPSSGTVTVAGKELTAIPERDRRLARRNIGMIFQQFNLFRSRTIAGNVAYPLKVAGVPKEERDRRVAELLDFVGLLERAHAYPEQLSGGQKQRVGIARALAASPDLLLADEATSALDPETTSEVLGLLRRVNKELGVTIIVITHEMDAVRQIADRVAVMEQGRVVEVGDVYDVFSAPKTGAAQRFVRTALHDRPSVDTLARLRERHPGRLVTVQITDEAGLQNRIDAVFRSAGVTAELVYGGVGEIRERRIGSLTYELTAGGVADAGAGAGAGAGAPDAIDRAVAALRADGVTTDEEAAA
ncbi:D-methionine transport system ATP-binding protein [Curtobacterium sp. PhB137]|uniref:methionine ABC transporter ATP-binding protein n=1 Tax=unclassified Curtobacterium TaxID=257496 RepID=UPI000F4F2BE4|nr:MULTISPECIES: methionine ABC transporter ATP-binding protein [unclassified Curtobacterium]RPE80413.1 D-methionine transport system ATP-binding protein [Curtobacterium sp. PhB137]TCU48561.1 D-methionine transport system ATP-binding protein [Curtobacterium sp. PhB146]